MKQHLLDYAKERDYFKGDWQHTNDNEVLFFFHLVIECYLAGEDIEEFAPLLENFYESVKIRPGLTHRAPRHADLNSFDNKLGECMASVYLDGGKIARECADYGLKYGWNYNNQAPNFWAMKAQMPLADYTIVLLAAGYRLSPYGALICGINMVQQSQGNMFRCRGLILERALRNRKDIPSVILKVFWTLAKARKSAEYRTRRLASYYGSQGSWKSKIVELAKGEWSRGTNKS